MRLSGSHTHESGAGSRRRRHEPDGRARRRLLRQPSGWWYSWPDCGHPTQSTSAESAPM